MSQDFVPDMQPVVTVNYGVIEMSSEELRREVIKARDNIDGNYQKLCQLLYTVKLKRQYESWGYDTFKDYVSKEVVFKITKALYLCQIWEALCVNQKDEEVFNKVMSLGWTKAKELIHIVNTENVDEWVEKAKHMTVEDLIKEKKQYLKQMVPDDPSEAIQKDESGNGAEGTPAEGATKTISFTFTYQEYMTLSKAIDQIKATEPGITNGSAVAGICQDFLGANPTSEQGKDFAVNVLKKYESLFGLRLVILDEKEKSILYGMDYLKQLSSVQE